MRAIVCLALFVGLYSARAWAGEQLPPTALWKRGNLWKVHVELFQAENPRNKINDKDAPSHFQMYITVNGREIDGLPVACWRLLYNPDKASGLDIHYFIFIDEKVGSLQGVRRVGLKKYVNEKIGATDYLALIDGPLRAFPFEFFPADSASTTSPSPLSARVERRTEGDRIIVEAVIVDKNTDIRVRQAWIPGELWWREYERSVNGVKVLSARREEPALAKKGESEKKPSVLPSSVTREDPYVLRRDPKLQAAVSVKGENPSFDSILNTLRSTTGLQLTVDPSLENHKPNLASLQINTIPSWGLMESLASKELDNGRWLKTTKGYRLTGLSKVPPVSESVTFDEQAPEPISTDISRSYAWLLYIAGSLLFLLILFSGVYFLRRRYRSKSSNTLAVQKGKRTAANRELGNKRSGG